MILKSNRAFNSLSSRNFLDRCTSLADSSLRKTCQKLAQSVLDSGKLISGSTRSLFRGNGIPFVLHVASGDFDGFCHVSTACLSMPEEINWLAKFEEKFQLLGRGALALYG